MNWTAYQNKNLIVPETVRLNEKLNAVLVRIDKYWPENGEKVTSGVRDPEDSLRIIRQYLRVKNLAKIYPYAMTGAIDQKDGKHYVWQEAWSHLLSIGVIINPPFPAECLKDYIRNGVNKKGQIIGQSPHIRGTAFDISGTDSEVIIKRLKEDGMIRGYLIERENNCTHVDIIA